MEHVRADADGGEAVSGRGVLEGDGGEDGDGGLNDEGRDQGDGALELKNSVRIR